VYNKIELKKKNLGISIVPTQPYWAALGAESRLLPGKHSSYAQWALTYCCLLHSSASRNEKLTHCRRNGNEGLVVVPLLLFFLFDILFLFLQEDDVNVVYVCVFSVVW
jgi:hypothetical protein